MGTEMRPPTSRRIICIMEIGMFYIIDRSLTLE